MNIMYCDICSSFLWPYCHYYPRIHRQWMKRHMKFTEMFYALIFNFCYFWFLVSPSHLVSHPVLSTSIRTKNWETKRREKEREVSRRHNKYDGYIWREIGEESSRVLYYKIDTTLVNPIWCLSQYWFSTETKFRTVCKREVQWYFIKNPDTVLLRTPHLRMVKGILPWVNVVRLSEYIELLRASNH